MISKFATPYICKLFIIILVKIKNFAMTSTSNIVKTLNDIIIHNQS